MAPAKTKTTPNVLPDWWAFSFMGLQAAALLPLTMQHLTKPVETFMQILPPGYDRFTDSLRTSLRVEMAGMTNAQSYPMIAILFIGCTLFARNSLAGQPKLQQRLVKLPIYTGLLSDVWLYSVLLFKLPSEVLWNRSLWTPSISGIAYGLPVASALKLIWLMGIGRDVV